MSFTSLNKLNVSHLLEKKDKLSYLSWASAWALIKEHCPDVTYEIVKDPHNLPYFNSEAGAMVYTKVTIDKITHEMWLPVMDGANKAMKDQPYEYMTKYGPKQVQAFTMFDVNKTIMRCLVKNLAMFGLGLYVYNGEDLPSDEHSIQVNQKPIEQRLKEYRVNFGKTHFGKAIHEIPIRDLEGIITWYEKQGKITGPAVEFVELASYYCNGISE